jgi:paraquat-inducible protein B
MKSFVLMSLLMLVLLVSCKDQQEQAKDELYERVMTIHDEIMPKMGDLSKYKKELEQKIDELASKSEVDSAQIRDLEETIEELDNSHEAMMGWMHQFDNDFEGQVNEEIMKYLNVQLDKIEEVGKMTNAALQDAQDQLAEQ